MDSEERQTGTDGRYEYATLAVMLHNTGDGIETHTSCHFA